MYNIGFPYPVVRWKKDGQYLDLTMSQRIMILPNGHLRIMELLLEDGGSYQCTATNMAGTRDTKPAARVQILRKSFLSFCPYSFLGLLVCKVLLLHIKASVEQSPVMLSAGS